MKNPILGRSADLIIVDELDDEWSVMQIAVADAFSELFCLGPPGGADLVTLDETHSVAREEIVLNIENPAAPEPPAITMKSGRKKGRTNRRMRNSGLHGGRY